MLAGIVPSVIQRWISSGGLFCSCLTPSSAFWRSLTKLTLVSLECLPMILVLANYFKSFDLGFSSRDIYPDLVKLVKIVIN